MRRFYNKFSTKPLRTTLRDTVLVTAITLLVTVVLMLIYYYVYIRILNKTNITDSGDTSVIKIDWTGVLMQTAAVSIGSQFLYEYLGVNAVLAENSIRYASNTTLNKFREPRLAMINKVYLRMLKSGKYSMSQLIRPRKMLKFAVKNLDYVSALFDDAVIDKHNMVEKFKDNACAAEFATMPRDRLQIMMLIAERLSEPLIAIFLARGIDSFNPVVQDLGIITSWNVDELHRGGIEILQKIKNKDKDK